MSLFWILGSLGWVFPFSEDSEFLSANYLTPSICLSANKGRQLCLLIVPTSCHTLSPEQGGTITLTVWNPRQKQFIFFLKKSPSGDLLFLPLTFIEADMVLGIHSVSTLFIDSCVVSLYCKLLKAASCISDRLPAELRARWNYFKDPF